jgi:hypothetical protein
MTVVKVQVAIVPPGAPALIYDKNRERITQQNLSRHVKRALKNDLKGYFTATWAGVSWQIGKRVKDEDW